MELRIHIEWLCGEFQAVKEVKAGDIIGEIGVLCYKPQLFTVRTKRLCQLLRMNRTTFLNIIQANVGDGTIIMNNLLQVRANIYFTSVKYSSKILHNFLTLLFSLRVAFKRDE